MNVAILIPTLGRPDALAPLLQNLRQTTGPFYRVYFVVDHEDQETRHVLDTMPGFDFETVLCDGTYPVKTNAGYLACRGEDLVLPTADDVVFHDGWYEAAVKRFEDPDVQVVGTLDLTPATAKGNHATMPILRRSYIEGQGAVWGEPGKVFHEGYGHNFCETELWRLASHRGVAVFERESVIEHLHPAWGTREADATDEKGNGQGWDADKALFQKRRDEWTA